MNELIVLANAFDLLFAYPYMYTFDLDISLYLISNKFSLIRL